VTERNAIGPRLTLEQIFAALSEIAQTGSSSERIKALALLAKAEGPAAPAVIPEPLNDAEKIDLLSLLNMSVGKELSRLAYRAAFRGDGEIEDPVEPGAEHLSPKTLEKIQRVSSVRGLYKLCPELRRRGRPGYHAKAGALARAEWCRQQAKSYFLDKLRARTTSPVDEAAPNGPAVGGGAS